MTDKDEKHNQLVRDFVMKYGKEDLTFGEFMTVMESITLAMMELIHRKHKMSFNATAEIMLEMVPRAYDRFHKLHKGTIANERPTAEFSLDEFINVVKGMFK